MSEQTPADQQQTQVLPTAEPAPAAPSRRVRSLPLLLALAGVLLLIAVTLLLVLLQQRGAEPPPLYTPPAEQLDPEPEPDPEPEDEAEGEGGTSPGAPGAPAVQPAVTGFSLQSESPRVLCEQPGRTQATLLLEWSSNLLNNSTQLRLHSATGPLQQQGLPTNGSTEYVVDCSSAEELVLVIVVRNERGSASRSIEMASPASVRIESLSVAVNPVLTTNGTLNQECLEATKPGGSRQAIVRLSWSTAHAASVSFQRTVQPGGGSGNVFTGTSPTSGSQLTTYHCGWTRASYELTAVGQDGTTVRRTVTIAG